MNRTLLKEIAPKAAIGILTGALVITGICVFKPKKEEISFKEAISISEDNSCIDECIEDAKIIWIKENDVRSYDDFLYNVVDKLREQLKVVELLPDDIELPAEYVTDNKIKIEYEVKAGDTLSEIATEVGISTDRIKIQNNLENDTIYPGQVLKITKYEYGLADEKTALEMLELYKDFDSLTRDEKIKLLNKMQGTRAEAEKWIDANGSRIVEYLCFGTIKSKVLDAYKLDEKSFSDVTINSYHEASDLFASDVEVYNYYVNKKGETKSANVYLTGQLTSLQSRLYTIQTAETQDEKLSYKFLAETIDIANEIITKDVELKDALFGDKIKLVKQNKDA